MDATTESPCVRFRAVSPIHFLVDVGGRTVDLRYHHQPLGGRWAVELDGRQHAACDHLDDARHAAMRLAAS